MSYLRDQSTPLVKCRLVLVHHSLRCTSAVTVDDVQIAIVACEYLQKHRTMKNQH
jgi:hypothetical protein